MTKPIPLLLALFFVSLAPAARAQVSANMSVKIDGETPENAQNVIYLNAKQCGKDADAKIEVSLRMFPNATFLEVWTDRGATGNDCTRGADRSPSAANSQPACKKLEDGTIMNPISVGTETVELSAQELFAEGEGDDRTCKSGPQKIYFVPLNSQTSESAGNPDAVSSTPITLTLTLDVTPPNPPTSAKASDGESQIGASWKPAPEPQFLAYRLYFDPTGISQRGAPCESEKLLAGKELADTTGLEWTSGQATNAYKDPKSLGMAVGEQIPVAVAVRDLANNESVISEVVCASYIDTTGFYDDYKARGGDGLTECAAHPWKSNGSASLAALFLIALGLMARRRLS